MYDKIFGDIFDKVYNNSESIPKIPISLFSILTLTMLKKSNECKCGMECGVSLYEIGYDVGICLGPKNYEELKTAFENLGLGEIIFEDNNVIKIKDNPVAKMIKSEEPINYFTAGILAGALESMTSKKVVVKETKCLSQGYDACYFEIIELDNY